MRHLDLFSGIGGFALGLGTQPVAFCEIDPFCQRVLAKHWPGVPIHDDIKTLRADRLGRIDVVTGGFPCQPVSLAGNRAGEDDERWLWPEFNRIIRECRPTWVIAENVPGLRTKGADTVITDLEEQGYAVWPLVVGAVHAGAPHRRQRVWIVAHSNSQRLAQWQVEPARQERQAPERGGDPWDWQRAPEPVLRRMDDGLPCGMDRRERLKALGNSLVPQIVSLIGDWICTNDSDLTTTSLSTSACC